MLHGGPPHVAIVGAGIVGCFLGGRLAQAAPVTLIGREHVLDPIRDHGLSVHSRPGRSHVPADAMTLASGPEAVRSADVVLVCTKAGSTADATQQFAPYLRDDALVIGFQNGLHSADLVREGLGQHVVLPGVVPFNVARTGPATYRQTSAGQIVLDRHPAVTTFLAVLRASGLPARVTADMPAVLHGKVLLNLNNAIQALSGKPLRAELMERDYRRSLAYCQAEALRVFTAAGVVPRMPIPLPSFLMPTILRLPTSVFELTAGSTLRIDADGTSSMSDDFAANRPTEIDEFQGEVSRMGRRLGVPTPACARVVELVHDAEQAGPNRHRWEAAELLAEIRSARTRIGADTESTETGSGATATD